MTQNPVRHLEDRGVHRVVMDHGANALDLQLLTSLRDAVAGLRADGAEPLLLASSHPTVFSPGWDLKVMVGATREQVAEVLTAYNALILELFSYPGPTAAAITGHAVAGGFLLAMSCDLRVMASGRPRIGFAELNLGVPIPAPCVRMVRARLGGGAGHDVMLGADGCGAQRARELGLIHRATSAEAVAVEADRELRRRGSKPAQAYAATKEFLYGDAWQAMADSTRSQDGAFLDCWFDPTTQQRIEEMVRSFGD